MFIIEGNCFGREISVPLTNASAEVTGGSSPDNTIYLPYKGVSRRHFIIVSQAGRWMIKDRESRNGTFLNGQKILSSALKSGDRIGVGVVKLNVLQAENESDVIKLQSGKLTGGKTGTEEVWGDMDLLKGGQEAVFYFPDLVFPEGMILGRSAQMIDVYQRVHSIAKNDINVLLVGETGVGKEVIAKTLHLSSNRSKENFVAVNCAAIPAELAEAELFGIGDRVATEVSKRKGKMVLADRGTLLLDEIASFPLPLQAKVLRAIEEKSVYPVGENTPVRADFRLIAASNEDPAELIKAGRLRADLYHRIATVEIEIPPLRKRVGDLEMLIHSLLEQLAKQEKKNFAGMTPRLFATLIHYSYPGNVRELVNILRSITAFARNGEILDMDLLPKRFGVEETEVISDKDASSLRDALDNVSKNFVLNALNETGWNITKASERLDMTSRGLRKMMNRLGIQKPGSDPEETT